MNPVVHFEMSYDDKQRMADFYSKAFGWKTTVLGPEMGGYVTAQTAETDENRMVKTPGTINGGFYPSASGRKGISVVISVDDIQEAMKAVKEAGGTVLGGSKGAEIPDEIPGVGLYAGIIDTEGNHVAMLQPHMK
jgi:predicted enzyme related to lactoylglutathione lyase